MSRAYLDGVELDERGKALLLNSIGLTTYTCKSCKGAYIVLKSILSHPALVQLNLSTGAGTVIR